MLLTPTPQEAEIIDPIVQHYLDNKQLVNTFHKQVLVGLSESEALGKVVHSRKERVKDPYHLRDKLIRKLRESQEKGEEFGISKENLFQKINDLAGVRLLHLHTTQLEKIDRELKAIFLEQSIEIIEGPTAKTWDDEYRAYFAGIDIATTASASLYTSVHYVIASKSKTVITCEIQVRTLMEEVWGEVDHSINYPHPHKSLACREQILALARSTSAATRLVDSIFASVEDFAKIQKAQEEKSSRTD